MARKQTREHKGRTLRIIGGAWRGRKISFAEDETIRPSPDRVRETLFNWIQNSIFDSQCLELYCGSAILSIEALSRGAKHVTIIDQTKRTIDMVRENLEALSAERSRFSCIQSTAKNWLNKQKEGYDIIFLDPPFDSTELEVVLPIIQHNNLLTKDGFIYIESAQALNPSRLPKEWRIYRSKQAAKVHYSLICAHID